MRADPFVFRNGMEKICSQRTSIECPLSLKLLAEVVLYFCGDCCLERFSGGLFSLSCCDLLILEQNYSDNFFVSLEFMLTSSLQIPLYVSFF